MLRFVAVLALALALMAPAAPASRAEDQPILLVNLTSDDVWTQQMALEFSRNYLNNTAGKLVIFLNVRAVGVANTAVPQHTSALTGKTPQQLLADLIADGARVFLCGSCSKQAGLNAEERIEGVEMSSPELHQILIMPTTKVMSF